MSKFIITTVSPNATYDLQSSQSPTGDSNDITLTLNTTGVQTGHIVPYTISGDGIDTSDFVGLSSLTGNFTIQNNTSTSVITPVGSPIAGVTEVFTVSLTGSATSIEVPKFVWAPAAAPQSYWISVVTGNRTGNNTMTGVGVASDSDGNTITVGQLTRVYNNVTYLYSVVVQHTPDGTMNQAYDGIASSMAYTMASTIGNDRGLIYTFTETGSNGSVISRHTPDGQTRAWTARLSLSNNRFVCNALCVDGFDNTYAFGSASPTSSQNESFLLTKFSPTGTVLFQKKLDGANNQYGEAVDVDSNNNVYVGGYGMGTRNHVILAKYDSAGALQWQKTFTAAVHHAFHDMKVDSSDNIFVLGSQRVGITWVPYLAKLSSAGVLIWQKTLALPSGELLAKALHISPDGSMYVAATSLAHNMLVFKFDTSGNFIWGRALAGSGNETIDTIHTTNDAICISGQTTSVQGASGLITARLPADGSLTGTYGNYSYTSQPLTTSDSNDFTVSTHNLTDSNAAFTNTMNQNLPVYDSTYVTSILQQQIM